MSAHAALLNGLGVANTVLMRQFASGVTTIYFQIENPDKDSEDEYATVYAREGKWLFEKSKREPEVYVDAGRKGRKMLSVADESSEMAEAMSGHTSTGEDDPIPTHFGATHVLIGEDRYTIERDETERPEPMDPQWYIYFKKRLV